MIRRSRSGFLLPLVAFAGLVLAVLLMAHLGRTGGSHRSSVNLLHARQAQALAHGAASLALAALEERAAAADAAIAARFVAQGSPADLEGAVDLVALVPGWAERLDAARRALFDGRGVALSVEVRVSGARALVGTTEVHLGADPREVCGDLVVRSSATVGAATREVLAVRPFKVVNLVLPVVSKFTLVLRDPEANTGDDADPGKGGYNCYWNRIDGAPAAAAAGNCLPLVCYNNGAAGTPGVGSLDLAQGGWIFLGASAGDVTLNLTSGSHPTYGEYFHSRSLAYAQQQQAARQLEYLVATPASGAPALFGETFSGGLRFHLKRRRLGFFCEDLVQPQPGDMGAGGLLAVDASSFSMASSSLHLFGSWSEESPTLVIGPVQRAYPEYAGIVADVNGDGTPDGTLCLLAFTGGEPVGLLPESFTARDGGATVQLADLQAADGSRPFATWAGRSFVNPAVCNAAFPYETMQSRLVYEAYLRSVDSLAQESAGERGEAVPPPAAPCLEQAVAAAAASSTYPCAAPLTLAFRHGDRATYYCGDPAAFFGADAGRVEAFERRLAYRFGSLDEYRAWSGQAGAGDLLLGTNIRLEPAAGAELDLRGVTRVLGGGVLATPGGLRVSTMERQGAVPLTLMAQGGDVTCEGGGPVQASLVAPEGRLLAGGGAAVQVAGNLVVRTLKPADVAAGGSIRWDEALDPTATGNGYEQGFRLMVADGSRAWGVGR